MTNSEAYIYNLSQYSFLSLWTYANPRGKNNKELCDVLIFCEPHILIVSVKEIHPTQSGDPKTDFDRWRKTALEKSFNQLYGAERYLNKIENVTLCDGKPGPKLPKVGDRIYHRIAIVIGGEKIMHLINGEHGKGYIHVFDSISAQILFSELDTIADFTKYLQKKEDLVNFEKQFIYEGEEDLLAFYLGNSEEFALDGELTILQSGLWEAYCKSPRNEQWIKDKPQSFIWDSMIEQLIDDFRNFQLIDKINYDDFELVARVMSKESRYNRIQLSKSFNELLQSSKIRARPISSDSGIIYILMVCDREEEREVRRAELLGRCMIVRANTLESNIIIGIATKRLDELKSFSLDVFYYEKPSLSKSEIEEAKYLVDTFG